ncbi:hypothetical protein Mapa_013534 [Marchantia paleacea]|nr:hypothetical protein Mapa_013534 [Marchantia paleacea]
MQCARVKNKISLNLRRSSSSITVLEFVLWSPIFLSWKDTKNYPRLIRLMQSMSIYNVCACEKKKPNQSLLS